MIDSKRVLVVGAGGLLGSELTKALLLAGYGVIACDINLDQMAERLCGQGIDLSVSNIQLVSFDVTNELSVKAFFENAVDICGAVNCSYPRNKNYGRHFFDVTIQDFNENLSLHLGSSFLFMQQCAAYFKRHKTCFSLVNISSVYGVIAPKFEVYNDTPMTMPVEYSAIKSALIHLTKYTVNYVKDSRFRINCVSPGGLLDKQPENFLNEYKKNTLGRGMLDVKDITGTIIFLLSKSSEYINAQNIIVDDGFTN